MRWTDGNQLGTGYIGRPMPGRKTVWRVAPGADLFFAAAPLGSVDLYIVAQPACAVRDRMSVLERELLSTEICTVHQFVRHEAATETMP